MTNANLGAKGPELFHPVVEGEDLGGTDKGEVQWVEKENQVLSCRKNTFNRHNSFTTQSAKITQIV